MKIAFVRKKYTFHGGAETFTALLIKRLIEKGHIVYIFANSWDNLPKDNDKINLIKIPCLKLGSFFRDLSFLINSYLILSKKKDLDIIQSHDKTLYQDIYRAGDGTHKSWLKARWQYANIFEKLSIIFNPWNWLILLIEYTIFNTKRYKKIIAISNLVKNNIINDYKIKPNDIEVIYNGVDLSHFNPERVSKFKDSLRSEFNISENDVVLLFVGSGFKRKGLQFLIDALSLIHTPLTLLIVGKGSKNEIKIPTNPHKIIFTGPRKDIDRFYGGSDVFILPTIYEPFGNVHLEALACGLPVITTKNSGASEIIKHGINGFILSKPSQIDELKNYIQILLDPNLRSKMSLEARKTALNFSIDYYINKMEKLYENILKEKNLK